MRTNARGFPAAMLTFVLLLSTLPTGAQYRPTYVRDYLGEYRAREADRHLREVQTQVLKWEDDRLRRMSKDTSERPAPAPRSDAPVEQPPPRDYLKEMQAIVQTSRDPTTQLRLKAQKGDPAAQNKLGEAYLSGTEPGFGDPKEEAVAWFRKAAAQGDTNAMSNLGMCYFFGWGVKPDPDEAASWFRRGNPAGQNPLGLSFLNTDSNHTALSQLAPSPSAAPTKTPPPITQLRADAERGDAAAQNALGVSCLLGRNTPKDEPQAVTWFSKAAGQGNAPAMYNLGVCNENGQGLASNAVQACFWYRLAANKGHARAQNRLGLAYLYGEGVTTNEQQAVSWFRKAAAQGKAEAMCNLGYCYESGQGVAVDQVEACHWYHQAAEKGDDWAQSSLGYGYLTGQGLDKNPQQALAWLRKAAEQGNTDAMLNLGYCYENGTGVAINRNEARRWYRQAADKSQEEANKALARLSSVRE